MVKRKIRRKRTMMYFIDAADEIIREEGIEKITIRKVADRAGYNSATLYNYFENLDHLIFLAAMRYIKDYALALPDYLKDTKNAMDTFVKIWECFCHFSYKSPEIYYALFFANLDKDLESYVADYYDIFPEELVDPSNEVSTMLLKHNIYQRGMAIVGKCVEEGFIRDEDSESLNEMATFIYEAILSKVIRGKMSHDEAVKKTIKYIKIIVNSLRLK